MPTFEYDTYVVFDIPDHDLAFRIQMLRQIYNPDRAKLPIEITITGSSGAGVFENDQDQAQTFAVLDQVSSATAPITFSFQAIEKFPNTFLYYLAPGNLAAFHNLHSRIISTGMRFKSSPFPFTPHCTIAAFSSFDWEEGEMLARRISLPTKPVTLDEMSVYSLNGLDCQLLYRTKLLGSE